ADIRLVASPVYRLEIGAFRHDEPLAAQSAPNSLHVVFVLEMVVFDPVLPYVADVFEEEKDQDVVLVFRRVNDSAKDLAGFQGDGVYFRLIDIFSLISTLN